MPATVRAAAYADMSVAERQNLQWFGLRTARKLPATCQTDFWSKLIPQASHSQPAVLHASLALAALHREILLAGAPSPRRPCADTWATQMPARRQQHPSQVSSAHYLKALRLLRAHASTVDATSTVHEDGVSLQALLIACILFISLECMKGELPAAHTHIRSGLAILEAAACPVDTWIGEAFARMELQFTLWTLFASNAYNYSPRASILGDVTSAQPRQFCSFKEAWDILGDAIIKAAHLTRICYDRKRNGTFIEARDSFSKQQQAILRTLRQWRARFDLMLKKPPPDPILGPLSAAGRKISLLIPVYHDMATIMTELCLCAGHESAFDTQLPRFQSMLQLLQDLYRVDKVSPDLRHFIMDLGCLAPLHYVAVKCRDHGVRWQAVEALEAAAHREGIWDARVTAAVARTIVEAEEGDLFEGGSDGVLVPEERRIARFDVALKGCAVESIRIFPSCSRPSIRMLQC